MNDIVGMCSIKIYDSIRRESLVTKTKDLNIHIKNLIDKYENINFNILNAIKNNNFLEIKIHKKESEKYNLLIKKHFDKNKNFKCFADITYEKIFQIINNNILLHRYELFLEY